MLPFSATLEPRHLGAVVQFNAALCSDEAREASLGSVEIVLNGHATVAKQLDGPFGGGAAVHLAGLDAQPTLPYVRTHVATIACGVGWVAEGSGARRPFQEVLEIEDDGACVRVARAVLVLGTPRETRPGPQQ